MRCPKSRFPIWIIVFDELELIIFVSQGLTLSTASLVIFIFIQFSHKKIVIKYYDRTTKLFIECHQNSNISKLFLLEVYYVLLYALNQVQLWRLHEFLLNVCQKFGWSGVSLFIQMLCGWSSLHHPVGIVKLLGMGLGIGIKMEIWMEMETGNTFLGDDIIMTYNLRTEKTLIPNIFSKKSST